MFRHFTKFILYGNTYTDKRHMNVVHLHVLFSDAASMTGMNNTSSRTYSHVMGVTYVLVPLNDAFGMIVLLYYLILHQFLGFFFVRVYLVVEYTSLVNINQGVYVFRLLSKFKSLFHSSGRGVTLTAVHSRNECVNVWSSLDNAHTYI